MAQVKFYRGLAASWNESTHLNSIYFATDTAQIIFNKESGEKVVAGVDVNIAAKLGKSLVSASWKTPDTITFNVADGSSVDVQLPMASASVAGLMSKEDFSKLAGIATGALVNVIEEIQLDGEAIVLDGKTANIQVANKIETAKNDAITAGAVTISEEVVDANGVYKKYTITQNNAVVGTINTTKDLVVKSGSVKDDELGGKVLELVLNDEDSNVISIPVTDLVDVYTAGQYIEIGENNAIAVKFADLDTALVAESAKVGGAIKAVDVKAGNAATAAANAQAHSEAVRSDLGESTAAAGTDTAFARIKSLEEDLDSLSGGAGSVSTQINNALDTLKGTGFDSVTLAALEDKVDANTGKVATLTGTGDGSVAKALADAKAYTDEKEEALEGQISSVSGAVSTEESRAKGEEARLEGLINSNTQALGTVDSRIDDAVKVEKERAEGAEAAINNKIGTVEEGKTVVGMIEAASAKATSKVAEGTDAGNNMTIVPEEGADGSVTYKINLSDVASASTLTDVQSTANSNKGNLETLMGEATVDGSIKQQIATAKSESYADAKAYADGLAGNYDAKGSAAAVETKLNEEVTRAKAAEEANATAITNLTNGQVKTNTGNIAANTAAISAMDSAYKAADAVLLGKSGDAATANTIYGAKAYADALLEWHEA